MKARPALVVRPLFVSQETAFALLGISPRKFRDLLVPLCRDAVVRMGKSALIPVDVAEDTLRELAVGAKVGEGGEAEEAAPGPEDDDDVHTADDILRALGRRRVR